MAEINKQQDLEDVFAKFDEDQQTDGISIEQYNKEIDEALAEVASGNFITQDEVEKQSAEWHKR